MRNEQETETLLGDVLEILQLSEEDLLGLKPTVLVKQATAWYLHKNTRMTIRWISERLKMGHRSNATQNYILSKTTTVKQPPHSEIYWENVSARAF
jgi:hypothetical protein